MKFSCNIFVLLCCVVGVLCQSQSLEQLKEKQRRELEIRRAMRSCIFENKVTYTLAVQYGKGDFRDSSDKGKCFLRCFAVKMKLFDPDTSNPQKVELLSYASYLSSADLPFSDIIDKCDSNTERSENKCDFVFRMYRCLWDGIKNSPEPDSFRNSFNDVFGFNQLYDQAEIKAELEAAIQEKVEQALIEKTTPEQVETETLMAVE